MGEADVGTLHDYLTQDLPASLATPNDLYALGDSVEKCVFDMMEPDVLPSPLVDRSSALGLLTRSLIIQVRASWCSSAFSRP